MYLGTLGYNVHIWHCKLPNLSVDIGHCNPGVQYTFFRIYRHHTLPLCIWFLWTDLTLTWSRLRVHHLAQYDGHPPSQNRRFSTEFIFFPEPMFFFTVEFELNLKLNFFLSILWLFLSISINFLPNCRFNTVSQWGQVNELSLAMSLWSAEYYWTTWMCSLIYPFKAQYSGLNKLNFSNCSWN